MNFSTARIASPMSISGIKMRRIRIAKNIDECRHLWESVIPREYISDLWEFRDCFHRNYQRSPIFLVVENAGRITGLLPMSWIDESSCLGYFPGEIWDGKTWIEQNRIVARDKESLNLMTSWLASQAASFHLRYLKLTGMSLDSTQAIDEIGYIFEPADYGYDIDKYFEQFSHKSIKKIRSEVFSLENNGLEFRFDCVEDFELMIDMNLQRYGLYSYFSDPRFKNSFHDLMILLAQRGWLRITTVLLDGQPAAIDMGCLHDGVYTLVAGGTSARFPGVAKLINLYHMRRACDEKMKQVDFMCGDFSWKSRFHLKPRPLYLLSNVHAEAGIELPVIQTAAGADRELNAYRN